MTITQINKEIKKEVLALMGKDKLGYTKTIVRNNNLYLVSDIIVSYESTCQIGVIIDYKLKAIYNIESKQIELIQY